MINKTDIFNDLKERIREIVQSERVRDDKLMVICELLEEDVPYYDWVGFYIVDPKEENELVLGPYVGEKTEHTRIPFGKGICGRAAENKETVIVRDVSKETNYLSCSINVKAEIVVPISKNGVIVAELDIDSHTKSVFSQEDRRFLENICEILSGLFC